MQIILSDCMSLDGVVQAPGGREEDTEGGFAHGGWSFRYLDEEVMGSVIDWVMAKTEALLFGRRTWQTMATHWPGRAGDPFADRMNEIPKYVASRTFSQDDLTWTNSTLLPADDAIGAVRELRERDGEGLQVKGSSQLASQLVEQDLVDEYRLMIEPILLGGGTHLPGRRSGPTARARLDHYGRDRSPDLRVPTGGSLTAGGTTGLLQLARRGEQEHCRINLRLRTT
jgi:dihydrofolate reductase